MRLTDLNPRWVLIHRWDDPDGTQHYTNGDASLRHGGGMSFDCPVHLDHRLLVWFANPLDGLPPEASAACRWQRSGAEFDTMTLTPSINATGEFPGCWHGHITDGCIR